MKTEIKIYTPSKWEDITIAQYREWKSQMKISELSNTKIKVMTCTIFCREPLEVIQSIDIKSLDLVYQKIMSVMSQPIDADIQKIISLNGTRYGFHPNLSEMTTGEWVDLDETIREADDIWDVLPMVLAILYRPVVKLKRHRKILAKLLGKDLEYQIEKYRDGHAVNVIDMETMDMRTANAVAVFFWTLERELGQITLRSIQRHSKSMKKETKSKMVQSQSM